MISEGGVFVMFNDLVIGSNIMYENVSDSDLLFI